MRSRSLAVLVLAAGVTLALVAFAWLVPGHRTTALPGVEPTGPTASGADLPAGGVVGLGDSVPAGSKCGCSSYVDLVAQGLARREHTPVPVDNLASDGQTTAGLLGQLRRSATHTALHDASVAIVTVGANDFDASQVADERCAVKHGGACYTQTLDALRTSLHAVLARVRAEMPRSSEVLVTGYWNVFLDGQVAAAKGGAYVENSDALTRQVNAVIAQAAADTATRYVDVYRAFKGDGDRDDTPLLASDGDHPNAAGHRAIATALLQALPS